MAQKDFKIGHQGYFGVKGLPNSKPLKGKLMHPKGFRSCAGCNRVIEEKHADKDGFCIVCRPESFPEHKPEAATPSQEFVTE